MTARSEFEGLVALVTGASSGIGRATAARFARAGAKVAIVARDRARLEQLGAELPAGSTLVAPADLSRPDQREPVVRACVDRFGRLDILVNGAGVIGSGTLGETSRAEWDAMLELNVHAVVDICRAAMPHLEATKGCVVNISSVAGIRSFPGILAYAVSKAAVDQFTRCLALEAGPRGVRVNAVNPGVVVTELHRRGGMSAERYAAFLEHSRETHPLGRVGQAEEVAEAIAYLASPRAAWVTGVTLPVDGGRGQTCLR